MCRKKLLNSIEEADLLLIGIGGEMEEHFDHIPACSKYRQLFREVREHKENSWQIPFLQYGLLQERSNDRIKQAYEILKGLTEGKDYFIISTAKDGYLYDAGFCRERAVTPCGSYEKLQCSQLCTSKLWDASLYAETVLKDIIENTAELKKSVCPICGEPLVFNNIQAEQYEESSYSEQWKLYMQWLQGTLNKKICILELGVGLEYPTVIRWPFEKITYLNQKAEIYRVHAKLFQLTEELKGKGHSIAEDSIDFLLKNLSKH